MVAIEEFSHMVSGVYRAAAATDTWGSAMAEIRSVFGGLTAALIQADGGNRTVKSANLSEEAATSYGGYYRTIDYVLAAVECSPIGLIRGGQELIALQPRSEFDADWMRPHSLTDGLFVRLSGGNHTTSFLVAGDRSDDEFATAQRAKLLDHLIPHLQQALSTERCLHETAIGIHDLSLVLDNTAHGIVLVDAKRLVAQMNQSAAAMLRTNDGLHLRAGTITVADPVASRRLASGIVAALGVDREAIRGGTSLLCPRRSGSRPYVIHVLPSGNHDAMPRALVVIIDPELVPEPPPAVLRRIYGLTHTEAVVATGVLRGEGLAAIAEGLSVSLATVKTHLQHIFAKTDTHRQAELVRLLLSISR